MMHQSHRHSHLTAVSDRSAQTALIGIMVLFAIVLIAGWNKLLSSSLPAELVSVAWLGAALLAVIAIALAKGIAVHRVQNKDSLVDGENRSDKTWIAYFIVLFSISALGTMNTAFYFGEGRLVLSEAIDRAHQSLDLMLATTPKILGNPQLDQKQAVINGLLVSLEGEITNANGGKSCGVGKQAQKIIREITQELPGFREYSGGTGVHACAGFEAKFKEISQGYRNQANQLLRNHPTYVAANGARVEMLLTTLRERIAQEIKKLEAAKLALNGRSDATENGGGYLQAQRALETAASTYAEFLVEMEKASSVPHNLPRAIAVDQARQLGSIAQIIPSLLGRIDRISTWIYLLAAILFDVILIMCFMRVLRSEPNISNMPRERQTGKPVTERDLHYLWVNPPL